MSNAATAAATTPNRSLVRPAWIVLIVGWVIMFIPFPGTGIIGAVIAGTGGLVLSIVNLARGVVTIGILQLLGALVVTPILYLIQAAIFTAALLSS
jgi:hypothetical protein